MDLKHVENCPVVAPVKIFIILLGNHVLLDQSYREDESYLCCLACWSVQKVASGMGVH